MESDTRTIVTRYVSCTVPISIKRIIDKLATKTGWKKSVIIDRAVKLLEQKLLDDELTESKEAK